MGEGAGVFILESLDHALERGATILGEVVGYGANCDAYHMTSPTPDGSGAESHGTSNGRSGDFSRKNWLY